MDKHYSHKKIYTDKKTPRVVIGWREWVCLPDLNIQAIKAKIDTGARTSALHAFNIERFRQSGKDKVRFNVHPFQRDENKQVYCEVPLKEIRMITDSSGRRELRYVIETPLILGEISRVIEITLTNRSSMTFRMLLGRKALQHCFIIDPAISYHT